MSEQSHQFSLEGKRICYIQANWHADLLDNLRTNFLQKGEEYQLAESQVDVVTVPGSLEVPLQAKLRAKTGKYDAIVVAGLITDGGIYRHEFVAQSVLNSVMQLQMEMEMPIIYAILTPHHFHDHGIHEAFFAEHLKTKGQEAANALYQTLKCCNDVKSEEQPVRGAANMHIV